MQKLHYSVLVAALVAVLLLPSCDGVFVPDPIDPRLPKYTEDGNNAAGAFIGDNVWTSIMESDFPDTTYHEPVIFLYSQNDSLRVIFDGVSPIFQFIEFRFCIAPATQLRELVVLNNKVFAFNGTEASAFCRNSCDTCWNSTGNTGQIYFRKVVYDEANQYITMSGTFGFTYEDHLYGTIQVSKGRFDYKVREGGIIIIQ